MSTFWKDFENEQPDFAKFARSRFEQHGLGLLATLMPDGAPRISGLEPIFHGDHLWLALMPGSVKGKDLKRDGRFALHNATIDKDVREGDVKIHGKAIRLQPGDGFVPPEVGMEAELFYVDLKRVASIRVDIDHLVITSWRPGHPLVERQRH